MLPKNLTYRPPLPAEERYTFSWIEIVSPYSCCPTAQQIYPPQTAHNMIEPRGCPSNSKKNMF